MLLINIIVISLFCNGIKRLFGDGTLLGWLGDLMLEWLPLWLCKPLFWCCACMASVWGTVGYLLLYEFSWGWIGIGFYLFVLITVSGTNVLIWRVSEFFLKINDLLNLIIEDDGSGNCIGEA